MKREELKTIDLLCDMGIDVNGNRNLQPWKAYDIDEVNLVINGLEAENERLKINYKASCIAEESACHHEKEMEHHYKEIIDSLRNENAKLKCLALHAIKNYFLFRSAKCFDVDNLGRASRYMNIFVKYNKAYRKAKKALREGK